VNPERPDLFAYLDHRAFLADWFTWKKNTNRRFSHRVFSRLAGVRSPSLLLLVTKGERNITANTLPGFIKALSLDPEEAAFFTLLVELDATDADDERTAIFQRIAATQRFRAAHPIEGESFRYLSRWYIPAVRELALCEGFRADASWISGVVRPRITEAQAQEALDTLIALRMLDVHKDGSVTVSDATLATPHEVIGTAVHNYHHGMLERSSDAITAFRPFERHLGAVTVAVPVDRVPELKAAVTAFQERFLDLCDGMADHADRVYQMNVQLFPLSDPTRPEEP
jgi:uncharacterized protein (TIGR02147 family)